MNYLKEVIFLRS